MHRSAKFFLACWVLASFSSLPAMADDTPDCRLTKYASLDIRADDPKRILVPVTLEGHEMTFIVDTGSPLSMLTESTVTELGLQRQMLAFGAAYKMLSGDKVYDTAVVPSFEMGGMKGKNFHFGVLPVDSLEDGLPGLLGADIVRNYDVEFDFAANKMNLFSPHHCPGKVVYWTREPYAALPFHFDENHHIIIPVTLDNVSTTALVDTGAPPAVSMTLAEARELFGWRDDPPGLQHLDRPAWPYTYPFKVLSLGGASVHNPTVKLRDNDRQTSTGMIVGLAALRAFRVYISYEDQMIYLTARDAH